MRVEFSPEAKAEFEDSEGYYERQVPGLGNRFRVDIRDALARLRRWPFLGPVEREGGDIRRLTMSRFPYKLLYSIELDHIYVIAVAHLHREPDYWSRRGRK